MKKLLYLLLLIPFIVSAKSTHLYNIMADEAEYSGLADEYTGTHHDSFIEEPSKKIYKWNAAYNDNEAGNAIVEKNNVLFANKCWQIFRTTDTGGTKMIYNGEAEDGKCLTNRPNHDGYAKSTSISLNGNCWYGTDYIFDSQNNTFKITGDPVQKIWNSENAPSLIGRYTCRSTNVDASCSTLYLIESLAPYNNVNVIPIKPDIRYPYIGSMNFNKSSMSLAYAGYMYGDVYLNNSRQVIKTKYFSQITNKMNSVDLRGNVYIADSVRWDSTLERYELVEPYLTSTISDLSSTAGKYVFGSTRTYGPTVNYIVGYSYPFAYVKELSNGQTINDLGNIYLGTSYITNNDGTYTIENPTPLNELDWLTAKEGHKKEYICPDGGLTCSDLRYITSLDGSFYYYYISVNDKVLLAKSRNGLELIDTITVRQNDYYENFSSGIYNDYKYTCETNNNICTEQNLKYITSKNYSSYDYLDNRYWGTGVSWDGTNYTLKNPLGVEAYDKISNLSTHHYTCLENGAKTCSSVAYVFRVNSNKSYIMYVILENGLTSITELYNNMLAKNTNNSIIKTGIDAWYKKNILTYDDMIEDTIYCNSRDSFSYRMGGWIDTNGSVNSLLEFYEFSGGNNISCTKDTDKFSIYNNQAKLDYKVGLPTYLETNLIYNKIVRTPGGYWLGTPSYYNNINDSLRGKDGIKLRVILSDGGNFTANSTDGFVNYNADNQNGVRPVISIKSNIVAYGGDGSENNPYLLRKPISNNITINNNNDKGIVNIEKVNDIEELSKVVFSVDSKEGYVLSKLEITDDNNEVVSYDSTENTNEYELIMPDSDITIKTVYEKVKNNIDVQIVSETENVNININDLTQVEYEEEVTFTITPIKGYKLNSIKVLDSNGKKIDVTSNNGNYSFIMPALSVSIIPTYERVSNRVSVDNNPNTKEFMIKVKDASLVVYEDTVKFTITPKEDYKLEKINIIDKEKNSISYKKTNKENEYEFIMPDTDVVITPIYKYIMKFIDGLNQNYNIYKDTVIKFRLNIKCLDFINNGVIYIDNELVDKKNYILSEGSTIITLNDKYSKSLKVGKHEIVAKLKDGTVASTNFTISNSIILDSIVDKIVNPNTVDKIIIIIILLLISLGIYNYLKHKKMKVN